MSAPVIKSITPNPALAGTQVIISGSNFGGAVAVNFGKVGCPPNTFTVNAKGTQIKAILPVLPPKTKFPAKVKVQVIVPGKVPSNSFDFTYNNSTPLITSVSPNPANIGAQVTITGNNFNGTTAVNFGTVGCSPNSFSVNAAGTSITATIPSLPAKTTYPAKVLIQVTVPGQQASNGFPFTINNPPVINTISIQNKSGLDKTKYTIWVAGFIQKSISKTNTPFFYLQSNGTFIEQSTQSASFFKVDSMGAISVPNLNSTGNNRLVFVVTPVGTTPSAISPTAGYTAYPFKVAPGVCPPGPYDIFEFGPMAQYDVSAVDSFGLNLSFTVSSDPLTYGAVPSVSRSQIATAFKSFVKSDPWGSAFGQLLYTSPTGKGYPNQINDQFSAIVSPKDWLAVHPNATGLNQYWNDTITAFFTNGNQLNFQLNAANAGNYSGTSNGTQFTLNGPNGMQIIIPAADFSGNQGFIQAVRAQNSNESDLAYKTFGQIEAAIFEAISRGVALDGVVPAGKTITTGYSSNAWTNTANWFTNHKNAYNNSPSVYDVYAKFFHYGTFTNGQKKQQNIFGLNTAGTFGMAYGFSLDENPNVGTWPTSANVPAKTLYDVSFNQNVVITIGPW